VGRRIAVGPDALLEGALELGKVGVAHQVVALVVERGVQEEAVVLELEVLAVLATPPLRSVSSCSPSASARTVTAHSLKAVGMGKGEGLVQGKRKLQTPRSRPPTSGSYGTGVLRL
jgi:hypothetical protein